MHEYLKTKAFKPRIRFLPCERPKDPPNVLIICYFWHTNGLFAVCTVQIAFDFVVKPRVASLAHVLELTLGLRVASYFEAVEAMVRVLERAWHRVIHVAETDDLLVFVGKCAANHGAVGPLFVRVKVE